MVKKLLVMFTFVLICSSLLLTACGSNSEEASGTTNDSQQENNSSNANEAGVSNQFDESNGNAEGETYLFKYGHISSDENVWHTQAEKFAEELERLSDGRMEVEFFPMGQLGNENDMLQQLETGTLDFAVITTAQLSNRSDDLNAWAMPFMFDSVDAAIEMSQSEQAIELLEGLQEQSLIGLSYNFVGNRHILMRDTPIESPEDLQGKKIRVTGGPAVQDFWNAVDASPEAMPLPEVYTSLQTGVIDGIDIDLGAILEQKLYEVADYLTLTNHYSFAGIDVMSATVYDSLSPEDQEIIKEAAKIAEEWGAEDTIAAEARHLEELEEAGLTINDFPYTDNFISIQEEIFDKYSDNEITKAFIDEFNK